MLRAAAPEATSSSSSTVIHPVMAPERRLSPSLSTLSSANLSSTMSTKQQRNQQLQVLRRQQQELFKMQRQQHQLGEQLHFLSKKDRYNQQEEAAALVSDRKHEPTWASQEIKDTWINVEDETDDKERLARLERRQSHLSDKHMNIGPMKLLSDETPPDDMDGSWGLDDLDDDQRHPFSPQQNNLSTATPTPTPNSRLNDQNDNKNNNEHLNTNTTNNLHSNSTGQRKTKVDLSHGYDHMGSNGFSQVQLRHTLEGTVNGSNDVDEESDDYSSGSFLSTHIRKSPPMSHRDDKNKYPWRDSKHDTIFTNLVDEHVLMEQSRGQNVPKVAPQPQTMKHVNHHMNGHASEADTNSSVSLGDIIDLVNKGEESFDPTRSSKFQQARQRLAELSPAKDSIKITVGEVCDPATDSSTNSNVYQKNQEAFRQQRLRVVKTAMKLDPSDDRSNIPSAGANEMAARNGSLRSRAVVLPTRRYTNIPITSRSSRLSSGSRHRSQTQSSRDNETGDRGSTTSRDSAYRDSLSGSTLGSAGFQAQLEGMNKHGLANVFVALKSAVVDQLFLKEPESTIKQDSSRILPHNVNTNSLSSSTQQIDSIQSQSEERNATPRPSDYVTSTSDAHRRSKTELDPAWTRQHVSKDQSKRTSSFVEVLANGTDLQSATNFSLRNTPPSERKNSDQVFAADSGISRVHEQLKSTNREANRLSRQKREVTFQSTSPSHKEDDDDDHLDEDLDDLGSLAGSRATENAFKSLAELDVSIDLKSVDKGEDTALLIGLGLNERMHVNDENMDDHLSAVSLPSKPKQRGGNSLKWENQLDAVSNADTSRLGANTSISHNASNMLPEQSSFSHAQGHLIRFLTGLHPWDEWDQVKSLDLTKREVESTITLNHLVPNLEVLILNDNQVLHLTGIPKTVKTLQVRSNLLDNLTNFGHLSNLQYLDISRNAIEDLTGLSGLIHLRELIAEGNSIRNLSALQQMDGLIRLDVSHNCLTSLDFRWSKLQRLEYLNASHNRIEQLENLESLAGLIHANLAHNSIEDISLLQPLRRLRILRLSENKLVRFDAMPFPGLRTLYLDDNRLQYLENCQKLTRLENFSARDQEGEGIAIDMTEFANSRKLYLSGNPVYALDFEIGFYRLEYLEICAGCLSELPLDFASLFPNLRGLNLSYNGLDSISALDGLHRLRRLIFVGNNLKSFSDVLSLLKRMRSLVTLDLRHNPLTSNMYPAMSIRQGSKYQDTYRTNQNSETELDWRRRDVGFRRALPDAMYIKRSVYRSAILKSCKRLEWFDGGAVQEKERARVPVVLSDMLNSYGRDYLTNNRREDEDEEFEFEEEYLEYYPQDELIDNQQQQDVDWLRSHMQLEQLNGDGVDNGDDDYDRDERDPEDITDHSKRPGSSVESGSLNSQHQHRSLPRRLSGSAAHQQPRRLQSRPGYQVVSPSPKGPIQPSKQSLNPSRSGDSNRLSSNAALSQQQQQQQQYTTDRPLKRLNKKPSFADKPVVFNIAPYDQQGQEQNGNEDNLECDDADIYYDGSPDKQYAVRTWRDEVNEISQRKLQSPRMLASAAGDARGILSSGLQEARPKSQQQQVLRRSDKRSVSGSGTRSSHGSHSGSISGLHRRLETSIMAVANNSSENRPVMERRSAGLRKLFNIPTPVPQQQLQQASTQQRSLMPSHRRRSDTTAAILMSSGLARPPSSTYTLNRQQPSLSRPVSQHGVLFGYESVEMGGSTVANNPMSQSYHQSSMSPMAGPIGMTSSGTILQKPNHRRRRSAGVRLSHGSSVSTRKKELLERDINNNQSPGLNGLAVSQFSPTMSPGYFGLNHHGTQSPFGFGKGTPLIGASSSRSLPNTPSKVNSGRASRISLGAGPHYGPQTLARDMELSEMAD